MSPINLRFPEAALVARLVFASACCASVLAAPPALSQSAADRATARQLATEGIKLYDSQKYSDALEKLERAEALYDAPVHLLYIARCQVKLGKLIEAAENYRRLARVDLDANAPAVFRDAQDSGETELTALEPRIPTLKISIEPSNASGMSVKVGDENVPVAALGTDRPVNPGELSVTANAPGYSPAQASIRVAEGDKKAIGLKLEPSGDPIPVVGPAATGPTNGPQGGDTGTATPIPGQPTQKPSKFGFMLGLRLAGALPSGALAVRNNPPSGESAELSFGDYAKNGGGAELHGGVRFLKYVTVGGYFGAYRFTTGSRLDNSITTIDEAIGATESTQAAGLTEGGMMVMAGTPPGQWGGFGELGVTFVQQFSSTRDLTLASDSLGSCQLTETLSGPAFRLGAGANLRASSWLHITPYLNVEFGSFSSYEPTNQCSGAQMGGDDLLFNGVPQKIEAANSAGHQLILVGIGGDFVFGGDGDPSPGP